MKCEECGSDEVVPIVYGSPDTALWIAMIRGKVHLGGSLRADGSPRWYCSNCSCESVGNSFVEYDRQVANAFHAQTTVTLDPSVDTMSVMMGRRVAQRTLYGFARMGASAIRIVNTPAGVTVSAFIDDEWAEFDWPLGKYLPEMIEAHRAKQIRERVVIDDAVMQVAIAEVSGEDSGLSFQLFSPEATATMDVAEGEA